MTEYKITVDYDVGNEVVLKAGEIVKLRGISSYLYQSNDRRQWEHTAEIKIGRDSPSDIYYLSIPLEAFKFIAVKVEVQK